MTVSALLSRRPHAPPACLTLWSEITLAQARVHEICGRARRTLALRLAAVAHGPVIWIAPDWGTAPLNPCGMTELLCPGQVLFVQASREVEMLWAMEEALKSGAAPVVVADMTAPPEMTPVRRLHLAAEAGQSTGLVTGARMEAGTKPATGAHTGLAAPLGLLLTPGEGGAPGIETRWSCDPAHSPGRASWRLARLRARMLPPKVWRLENETLTPWAEPARPRTDTSQEGPTSTGRGVNPALQAVAPLAGDPVPRPPAPQM